METKRTTTPNLFLMFISRTELSGHWLCKSSRWLSPVPVENIPFSATDCNQPVDFGHFAVSFGSVPVHTQRGHISAVWLPVIFFAHGTQSTVAVDVSVDALLYLSLNYVHIWSNSYATHTLDGSPHRCRSCTILNWAARHQYFCQWWYKSFEYGITDETAQSIESH